MKALVVYYSRTGHTKEIAETIADMLSCSREEIIDTKKRSGPLGFMRSGYQTKKKSLTDIKDLETDVSVYDLVIVGTPVWGGTVSVPVRTFLHQYKDLLKSVAFFSTHGGEDTQDEFNEMEAVSFCICVLFSGSIPSGQNICLEYERNVGSLQLRHGIKGKGVLY